MPRPWARSAAATRSTSTPCSTGRALYVKSPLAATLLPFLAMQGMQLPSGDLSGWLKLGTAEELSGITGMLGQMPESSDEPGQRAQGPRSGRAQAAARGRGRHRDGRRAASSATASTPTTCCSTSTSRSSRRATSPASCRPTRSRASATRPPMGTLSADVWLDAATGRPNEIAIHAARRDGQGRHHGPHQRSGRRVARRTGVVRRGADRAAPRTADGAVRRRPGQPHPVTPLRAVSPARSPMRLVSRRGASSFPGPDQPASAPGTMRPSASSVARRRALRSSAPGTWSRAW